MEHNNSETKLAWGYKLEMKTTLKIEMTSTNEDDINNEDNLMIWWQPQNKGNLENYLKRLRWPRKWRQIPKMMTSSKNEDNLKNEDYLKKIRFYIIGGAWVEVILTLKTLTNNLKNAGILALFFVIFTYFKGEMSFLDQYRPMLTRKLP